MRGTTGTMIRILLLFWAAFALLPTQQFEFGDMLSVGRLTIHRKPLFTHWAIYVGKGPVKGLKGKKDDQDIFHITGPVKKFSNCVFGKMKTTKYVVSNYLDIDENGNKRQINSRQQMIDKINELYLQCGYKWRPRKNNCEHIATSIRYGFKHCEQRNTRLQRILRKLDIKNEPDNRAGKRSLMDLLDHDSSLAAAGA